MELNKYEKTGLTAVQVAERETKGLVNKASASTSKTVGQIIAGNIFTFFNAVNFVIFIFIIITGKYINALFMGVIVSNTIIGIVQEIRAKQMLDKLKVITAAKTTVIRDGIEQAIAVERIVMDDICVLKTGDQVSADSIVLESQEMETDESLLTGESEPVRKQDGDKLLSGSFTVAGRATAKVVSVGLDNYAQKIAVEARRYKRAHSEILTTLNRIIKFITIIIGPIGILLFASQYFRSGVSWRDAVVSSASGIIGMIPEGLVLLTSIAFAVGVVKLATRRTVVQELAGIEVLARVNILCLDKTGTLTKGTLEVSEIVLLGGSAEDEIHPAIAAVTGAFEDNNSTGQAMAAHFTENPGWKVIKSVPFSSKRKWSGAAFEDHGSWIIGAPEFVLSDGAKTLAQAKAYAEGGYRVILLAHSKSALSDEGNLPEALEPKALILLSDAIRPEAKAALDYFAENGVEIKVISGDSPATVVSVAMRLDLKNADKFIDMSKVSAEYDDVAAVAMKYTVFGRVSPQQKKLLIRALRTADPGKVGVVAMTGDGVNDVLALREADCGIAMASGSEATKNTAHIVLLDSDFTALPGVVAEGRQVINNIERVASLYLVKTTFSVVLSLFFIIIGAGYPFFPIHQTLIGSLTIGIPSFFLALEANTRRVESGFLRKILLSAFPGGLTVAVNVILIQALKLILPIPDVQVRLISVLITGIIGLLVLYHVSRPLNMMRSILLAAMTVAFFGAAALFADLIDLPAITAQSLIITAILAIGAYPLMVLIRKFLSFIKIKSTGA